MNEYKGIINKSIINSYKEVLVIDIMEDKLYKYLIKEDKIFNDKELSYMQYLNDEKTAIGGVKKRRNFRKKRHIYGNGKGR